MDYCQEHNVHIDNCPACEADDRIMRLEKAANRALHTLTALAYSLPKKDPRVQGAVKELQRALGKDR